MNARQIITILVILVIGYVAGRKFPALGARFGI